MITRYRLLSIIIAGLAALGTGRGQNPVTDWNNVAITTPPAAAQVTAPDSMLYLVYLHLAIYDPVNGIDHSSQSYGPDISAPPNASKEAAAIEAAHRMLVSNLVPSMRGEPY
jgi:hypothetical protein